MHCHVEKFFSVSTVVHIVGQLEAVGLIKTYRDIFTIVTIYVELAYNSSNFVIIYVGSISIFLR